MTIDYPLISIVLPTYNAKKEWLSEAIDSVLNQTYSNRELIIINDASTNNIEITILEYAKKDGRIKYYKNEQNMELTKTLNKGIDISQGEYIARIDDDDIRCDPKKLEKQVEFMEKDMNYGLCGTGVILIDENGNEFDKILSRQTDATIRNNISSGNQFAHSSVIVRKSIVDKVGGYLDNNVTKYAEDYDLWLRIGLESNFYNLPEYCIKYRVRKGSISTKKGLQQRINALRIYLRYKDHYPHTIIGALKQLITILLPNGVIEIFNKLFK